MLHFQRPFVFLLLLLLPAFALLRRIGRLQAVSLSLPLGNWNGFVPEKKYAVYLVHRISQYALACAFLLTVSALADPVRQTAEPMYSGAGQALMFVLDCSPSMAAQDMGMQTRFEAAKRIIHAFVENYAGDSFGLTALGSSAAVLIPPTIDQQTFLTRLDQLQIGELGDGTALGMGLASAVLHLTQYAAIPSYIILFTDGDNNTGEVHPRAAADIIKHKQIGFSIIGLGKSGYAPVKYFDPLQNKEISGTLHTVFDESELQKIARYGNGRYFSAKSPEILTEIFTQFTKKIPATLPSMTVRKYYALDRTFILIAMGLAAAAWLLRRLFMQAVS